MTYEIRPDPFPSPAEMAGLWQAAWRGETDDRTDSAEAGACGDGVALSPAVLARSLGHLGAYRAGALIGFVNIAWDGGIHAFILDPCVAPAFRRKGIATALIGGAIDLARSRGARWLHVDYEPHLDAFYRGCGFRPSLAGVMAL